MTASTGPARGLLLLGVASTSAALMASEIVLTRVLSVTVWYHFAFFAISVALLGTGVAALGVHFGQRRLEAWPFGAVCSALALGQAAAGCAVALLLVRVTPDWFGGVSGAFTLLTPKLFGVFVLTMLPFVCGGGVLALVVLRERASVDRVYFADLGGAAVGCALTIPLLSWLGGPRALVACAGLSLLAALCLGAADRVELRRRAGLGVSLGVVWLVLAACGVLVIGPARAALELRSAKGIDLVRNKPELSRWNAFSHVAVFDAPGFRGWGLSPRYAGPIPAQKTLVIDMNALTTLTRFDGDLSKVAYVQKDMSAFVYRLGRPPRSVCVIGAGAGKDVLSALAAGARSVDAVEINPLIVDDVMRGAYRGFTGGLYARDDVHLHIEDGRTFVGRSTQPYDVILISMVDTSAATAAGAYALTENGLYTVEAFSSFLAHLQPGGVLTVSTVSLPGLAVGARLAAIAREAVLARGGDPLRSIAVARTPWMARPDAMLFDILIKPDGFSDAEISRYRRGLYELGFVRSFVPGPAVSGEQIVPNSEDALINAILTVHGDAELTRGLAQLPVDVTATHDDRPFFFYQNRFADFAWALWPTGSAHPFGNGLTVLAKVLVLSLSMLLLSLVLPLAWLGRLQLTAAHGLGRQLAYVASLGVGFMCVEIALLHRMTIYLGQPTYTLVAVLLVLLLVGGAGSRLLAARLAQKPRLGGSSLALIALLIAVFPGLANMVCSATQAQTLGVRASVAALLIAPLAFLLGSALPAGLLRSSRGEASRLPWLWGVNAAASVFGSIAATLLALHAGVHVTMWTGALLYLLAAAFWSLLVVEPDSSKSSA